MFQNDRISHWQTYRAEYGVLPTEAQDELRYILKSIQVAEEEVRSQISDLLNPEVVEQIRLSDEQLAKDYSIVTTNNYIPGPYRSAVHRRMFYDVAHGFYVVLDIKPLE